MRRLVALLALAAGAVAAVVAVRRGLGGRRGERLEVYFEDGSLVSLGPSSSEAQRLLPFARDILAAARGGRP